MLSIMTTHLEYDDPQLGAGPSIAKVHGQGVDTFNTEHPGHGHEPGVVQL